jgi:hypothetical protein
VIPALRITSPQRGVSATDHFGEFLGRRAGREQPELQHLLAPLGDWIARLISALMRSTIGRGVAAGAMMPFQPAMSSG